MSITRKLTGIALLSGLFLSFPLSSFASAQESNLHANHELANNFSANTAAYKAVKQADGSALVTITNGYFDNHAGKVAAFDNQGNILEVLPMSITTSSNKILALTYSIIDKTLLRVDADISSALSIANPANPVPLSRSGWGDYFNCVAKNMAGGIVGGAAAGCVGGYLAPTPAACATGAGVGAVTGGIGTGIGSLF
ncbi:hypothetical protein RQN30_08475 [Arcanobacterium hippocoleae]